MPSSSPFINKTMLWVFLFLRKRPRPSRKAIPCASGWGKDLDPSMTSWRHDVMMTVALNPGEVITSHLWYIRYNGKLKYKYENKVIASVNPKRNMLSRNTRPRFKMAFGRCWRFPLSARTMRWRKGGVHQQSTQPPTRKGIGSRCFSRSPSDNEFTRAQGQVSLTWPLLLPDPFSAPDQTAPLLTVSNRRNQGKNSHASKGWMKT